jgi:hypothetical protein
MTALYRILSCFFSDRPVVVFSRVCHIFTKERGKGDSKIIPKYDQIRKDWG